MKTALIILLLAFLMAAIYWMLAQSDWHINRNKYNQLPTGELKHQKGANYLDEAGLLWELQPHIKNKFHQPDQKVDAPNRPYPNMDKPEKFDPNNSNLKFLSRTGNGGSYEAILQPDGTYLTKGLKQGTYNYGHPSGLWGSTKHVFADVIPHFFNSKYGE